MPSKTYSEKFKHDAVTLYGNSPGASTQTITTNLGINRASLHNWLKYYGTGIWSKATTKASMSMSGTGAERIRQLEQENARLREDRDILPPKPRNIFPARNETLIRLKIR